MKFLSFTLVFFMFIGLSLNTRAQCEIGEIVSTPTPCDTACYFNLILDFDYANVGSMGFTVQGNGGIYGTFEYSDLPVTLNDLECDGITDYEFVVRDIEFPDCSNFTELGIIYCEGGPCNIWNVDVFPQECEGEYFYVQLGFWYENVGTEGFRVQGNGNNYGDFEYDDRPIMIGPLLGDGVTEYEFVVIDNEFEDCSDWAAIDPVDCPGGECDIWDLVVDDHPCDSNGIFYAYVNFEYENVSEEGFRLYINYVWYDDFTYDQLPLWEVGPFIGDGTTVYHIMVVDLGDESCAEDLNFGPIDCGGTPGCNIWDVTADILPCNEEGYFNVLIDFDFINVGFDGFTIQGNGANYGSYEYEDLPIFIGPLLGDGTTIYEFVVSDIEFEDCSNWTAIDPVDCNTTPECEIGELETTILPCNEDDEFYVLLNFDYANTSDGFSVLGNGAYYGDFLYANLPVEIGPLVANGTTVYEFLVQDDVYEDCEEDTYIDPVNCDTLAQLMNFTTHVISCDDEMYELKLDFEAMNPGDMGFSVKGNGVDYGSYAYDLLPVTIGPLSTDGTTAYHFIVEDKASSSGNWERLIPFTCESLGIAKVISEIEVGVYPNPSSGSVTFEIPHHQRVNAKLYNSNGILVNEFVLSHQHQLIDLDEGMYYYRLQAENGMVASGKFIVVK